MTFGLRLMISSVAPTRLLTFYTYLITKIGNRNLKNFYSDSYSLLERQVT